MGVRPDGTSFGILFDTPYKAKLTTTDERINFETEGELFSIFDVVWLRSFEYQTIKKNLHENGQWIRNC